VHNSVDDSVESCPEILKNSCLPDGKLDLHLM